MFRFKNYINRFAVLALTCLTAVLTCFAVFCASVNLDGARVCYAEAPAERTRVVGYLPDWSYSAYKNIDFSALTHINISFCNLHNSNPNEFTCGIPDSEMRAIVEKAHSNHVKVMMAIGGGGNEYPYQNEISNEQNINSLNKKIEAFCVKHGLDGVDLDIEKDSNNVVWKNYGNWITALRAMCDEHGWTLSTATAQWVAGSTSSETFALFDFLNVMAYDNYDDIKPSGSSQGNTHSSYAFCLECLNYFNTRKNVPKEKLVLGVPFYGRGYKDDGTTDWNLYVSFSDIVKKDDANYNADFADYYDGAAYPVAYTGASTMRDKCALAKEYGGIMIWEITLDAEGEYSLLSLIKAEMSPGVNGSGDNNTENGSTENAGAENGGTASDGKIIWIVVGAAAGAAAIAAVTVMTVLLKKNKANVFIRRKK